ncbi:MAG: cysteine desulfurase [Deltaproteobacteria bacterium]|nr:cysteine desulfurase [Deltaproteobacteria bacterium]
MSGVVEAAVYDVEAVRADFPILGRLIHGKPLVYLDSAATTHKPRAVLQALERFYRELNSNVHRGVHLLSHEATTAYEAARLKVQRFIHAASEREVVFVRGTTEAINLVAQAFGRRNVHAGDDVVVTTMEHHSNIVPWQMLCTEAGARLRVAPITDAGELDLDALAALLGPRTRLVAVTHVSNVLGTVNPVARVVEMAHACGARVLVDGAQAVPHLPVDVQALGCDFYAFSGHKLYGPTGIGVLWGREELLEAMPPWQGGGDMIAQVTFERTTYNRLPYKFEAGTPDVAGAVGLGAAIDWLGRLDPAALAAHEADLVGLATRTLGAIPGLRLVGTAPARVGAVSFVLGGIHPHDIGSILDQDGIAIRAGHLCAQPLMERLGVPATARASFGCYSTRAEIDALAAGVRRVQRVLG